MKSQKIPFENTNQFSQAFLDYISGNSSLRNFYGEIPEPKSFKSQIEKKQFPLEKRKILKDTLIRQYEDLDINEYLQELKRYANLS